MSSSQADRSLTTGKQKPFIMTSLIYAESYKLI